MPSPVRALTATQLQGLAKKYLHPDRIAIVVAGVVALLLARNIVGPVNDMAGAMVRLAFGNREEPVPHLGRRDEIGGMAPTLVVGALLGQGQLSKADILDLGDGLGGEEVGGGGLHVAFLHREVDIEREVAPPHIGPDLQAHQVTRRS